jgi:hypothetical protein
MYSKGRSYNEVDAPELKWELPVSKGGASSNRWRFLGALGELPHAQGASSKHWGASMSFHKEPR